MSGGPGVSGRGATRLVLVVAVGLLLVRLAVAFTVPLGSAPDEPDHFIKAFGAARLDFGDRRHVPDTHPTTDMGKLNQSLQVAVDLGNHPLNPTWTCNAFHPELSAACDDPKATQLHSAEVTTNFGTFQPYLYVVIGLPSLFFRQPDSAMLGMRLLIVAWTTLFSTYGLLVAVRRAGNRGLLAALVGSVPMVLYTQGTLSTSGIEVASAFAMYFSALEVLSPRQRSTWAARTVLVLSTVSLSLSRPLSVVVAAVVIVLSVLTVGWRDVWRRIVALPRVYSVLAALAGVGAVAANLGWSLASPAPYRGKDLGFLTIVGHYFNVTLPGLWRGVIGVFEWLDTDIPLMAVIVAWAAIVAVLAWSSNERDRTGSLRVWLLVAATIAFGFLADYTVFARVGGAVQGRHLLPLFQLWPLVAIIPTEGADRPPASDGRRVTPLRVGAIAIGAVTALSWWYIARREAVGIHGSLDFLGSSKWRPAVGWALPLALVVVGVGLAFVVPVAVGFVTPDEPIDDPTADTIVLADADAVPARDADHGGPPKAPAGQLVD